MGLLPLRVAAMRCRALLLAITLSAIVPSALTGETLAVLRFALATLGECPTARIVTKVETDQNLNVATITVKCEDRE
jgi:hypothetical protein